MNLSVLQTNNLEVIIKLIDTLVWPVTLLVIILLFRKNLQNGFNRIGSIKADTTGIAITFDKQLEATEKLFEQIKPQAISKSSAHIKPQANREATPYNQILNVRNNLINFLITKSKANNLDFNAQLPSYMCSQLLRNNTIQVNQAQMIEALLNLTANANENTTQKQADAVHQLLAQVDIL